MMMIRDCDLDDALSLNGVGSLVPWQLYALLNPMTDPGRSALDLLRYKDTCWHCTAIALSCTALHYVAGPKACFDLMHNNETPIRNLAMVRYGRMRQSMVWRVWMTIALGMVWCVEWVVDNQSDLDELQKTRTGNCLTTEAHINSVLYIFAFCSKLHRTRIHSSAD